MSDSFNLKDAINEMATAAQEAASAMDEGFEARVLAYRRAGLAFSTIVDHERKATPDIKKNVVFSKHESTIKKVVGLSRTCLVDECYAFARLTEPKLLATMKAYLKVGIGDKSFDANGNVRLRTDYLAAAVNADLEVVDKQRKTSRWNRKNGTLAPAKRVTKKKQIADLSEKIEENDLFEEWDVSYLTVAEMESVHRFLAQQIKLAKLTAS